jgi:hypothetical protein
MVLKDKLCEDVASAYLAQCRVQLLTVVNTVMNFRCPLKGREFADHLLDYKLLKMRWYNGLGQQYGICVSFC